MLRILIIFQKIYYNYLLNYDIIRHIDKLEMWKDVDKMKKLIFSLIFLVGAQGFSDTCSFAPNPDTFLERVIKKIQSEKRTNHSRDKSRCQRRSPQSRLARCRFLIF